MAKARTRRRGLAKTVAALASVAVLIGCDSDQSGRAPLAETTTSAAMAKLHTCAACHGSNGISQAESFPNLAGQQKDYIVAQLTAFRDHTRRDRDAKAYMWGFAARLDPASMRTFAAYYAAQPPAPRTFGAKAEIAAGEVIYRSGVAERGVIACVTCHGEKGEGNAEIPRLAGLQKDYLTVQLEAFTSGARDNGAMNLIAKGMTRADIKAVAAYIDSVS